MIINLQVNQVVTPTRVINPTMVSHWKYAKECASIGGGLMPGAELVVEEVSKTPGQMWVRVQLPGSHPPKTITIAGEEYGSNFRLLR